MKKRLHFFSVLLAVGCLFLCLWWTLGHPTIESNSKENSNAHIQTARDQFKSTRHREQDTFSDFRTSEFYRTIIDNNLF